MNNVILRHLICVCLAVAITFCLLVGLWLLQAETPKDDKQETYTVQMMQVANDQAEEEQEEQPEEEPEEITPPELEPIAVPIPEPDGFIEVPEVHTDMPEIDFEPKDMIIETPIEKPKPKPIVQKPRPKPKAKPRVVKETKTGSNTGSFNSERVHGMSDVDSVPRALASPRPAYPSIMRSRGKEGVVRLMITIDKRGNIENVQVLHSDHSRFKSAVMRVIHRWRFSPGKKNGQPVRVKMILPFRFDLE